MECHKGQSSDRSFSSYRAYTADLIPLIERHALLPHLYADDTQILGFCSPSRTASLQEAMSVCIDEVS